MSESNATGVRLAVLLPAINCVKSRQLRIFLCRYISDGIATGNYDAESAARIAYPKCCRSAKAVKVRALQILALKSVKRVLDSHFRRTSLQSALDEVRRLIRRAMRRNSGNENIVAVLTRMSKTLETLAGEKSNV